jgi:methionyl-tRNA formyltransferase
MTTYKRVLFGIKDLSILLGKRLSEEGYPPDLVVTIKPSKTQRKNISGFAPVASYAEKHSIPCFTTVSYSLTGDDCVDFFKKNTFLTGFVLGWQRIIPAYVLSVFSWGIFGLHGSCGELPYGKGRSPINWSLAKGDSRFVNHLFKYTDEPDNGPVFAKKVFEITPFDTARTLQYKFFISGSRMFADLAQKIEKNEELKFYPRPSVPGSWYEKRYPENGRITFSKMKTREIYNLVRASSNPFPLAFAVHKTSVSEPLHGSFSREKVFFAEGHPFDSFLDMDRHAVGEVVETFDVNTLIIKTLDGSILLKTEPGEGLKNIPSKGTIFS